FWKTATASTLDNGEMEITAIIDGKVKIVTEESIRRHLKLEDSDGISNLTTTEIFEQLALMGMVKNLDSKTRFLMYPRFIQIFLNKHKRLLLPHKRTYIAPTHTQKLVSNIRRASKGYTGVDIPLFPTMLVQGPIFQGEGSIVPVESHHTPTADEAASICVDVRYGRAATTVTGLEAGQGSGNIDKTPTMLHDLPFLSVHTLRSDEGRMQHNKLMDLVTKLSNRVVALETDLMHTKKVYVATFTNLIKKVKRLEKKDKLSKSRRKLRLVLSDKEASIDFTTANVPVTTVGAEISTTSPEVKTASDSVDDIAAESLVYIRKSAVKTKDKETAIRLQEEFDEEERQRIARVHEAARSFSEVEWEDIRARVKAFEELVQRLQTEEREKYSKYDQAKMLVDLINQRKRYFAAQKAKAKRNKPMTQAQQRTYMSNYIKHMGNYKLQQLKRLSFNEIKDLFESTMRRANTFIPMETKIRRGFPELVADSSQAAVTESTDAGGPKRVAKEELGQQSSKKQKSDELSQEELQDDLVKLWSLVQERFNSIEPTEDKEIEIWVELKRLFEPDADDEL
ncbi:hypothetical protein Tco_0817708, partial [Tanacetum coccineum]